MRGSGDDPWPELPPLKAFEAGVPLGVVLHQGIRAALHRSLAQGFRARPRRLGRRPGLRAGVLSDLDAKCPGNVRLV
jgi:hypothetical protein